MAIRRFTRWDVRPLFDQGAFPADAIRQRIEELAADEGLILVAPCLPKPLLKRLRAQGFETRAQQSDINGDWYLYLWREEKVNLSA